MAPLPVPFLTRIRSSPAAKNAAASYFAFVSTALWGFLSIPIAVAYLDKAEIGLWAVVNTLISYLVWFDLGVGPATGRLIADSVARNDHEEIDRWWTATRLTLWSLGSAVILLGIALVEPLVSFMKVDDTFRSDARWLLLGGTIVTGLSFSMRGTVGLLTAQNRFHWVLILQGIVPWVNLAGFYIGLRAGWGLKAYLFGLICAQLLSWILFRAFLHYGPYRPRWRHHGLDRQRFKRLFSLSGNMMLVGMADNLCKGLPPLMLARIGNLSTVPVYQFTSKASFLASNLLGRICHSFYPGMQRMHVLGMENQFLIQYQRIALLTLSASACAASAILLINPVIVQFLAGSEYFGGRMVNVWFAIGMITVPATGLYTMLLPISGSMGKAGLISVTKLLLGIMLGYLAWQYHGMAGFAAVFALLPLVDMTYAAFRGPKACGYTLRQLSPGLLFYTAILVVLVYLAGSLGCSESGIQAIVLDRIIDIPHWSAMFGPISLLALSAISMICIMHQIYKSYTYTPGKDTINH